MSSDKNFPQRHITKRSLEKSNVCTFSSYIIQTLLKHSRLFAFVRASHLKNIIQNKRVGINAYFSADRSNTLKFPYLVHLFRHYCVKIIAACPFFLQGEHNIPLSSIFFSCPVRFFFTPFPSTQCPYTRTRTRRGRMLRVTK